MTARPNVCVIGSGPGGALVAEPLAARGHDVVVLEAGKRFSFDERRERQRRWLHPVHEFPDVWEMGGKRDAYSITGGVDYDLNHARVKGVGGTSLHWGGLTPRLHPEDFEMQSRHGIGTDWPIDYWTLSPYYNRAEQMMGVAGGPSVYGPPRDAPYPLPAHPPSYSDRLLEPAFDALDIELAPTPRAINSEAYDGRSICVGYGTCTPVCPSGAKYSADVHVDRAEGHGVRVITEAPVVRLEHDPTGRRVVAAVYRTPDGGTRRQEADAFVVACGAVETARLLLLSHSDRYPDGLANSSGLVGRYFMEHPGTTANGYLDEPTHQQNIGYSTSLSEQFYEHDSGPTGSMIIEPSNEGGPPLATTALERPTSVSNLLRGQPPGLLRSGGWGDEQVAALREQLEGVVQIAAWVEMLPEYDNVVGLDPSTEDDNGLPVPALSFTPGENARTALTGASDVLEDILDEVGATGRQSRSVDDPWYAKHHMGTTRMGSDPLTSVVDADLRAHDLSNLYVSSSSVFVTGGAANPTLTIAALALRLADHLDARLRA